MLRTDFTTVTAPVGGELVNRVLEGTAGTPRHLKRFMIAPLANAAIVAYIDTDRIALADSAILPALDPWVELDTDLEVGKALSVGVRDLAAAGHANINVIYQWEE